MRNMSISVMRMFSLPSLLGRQLTVLLSSAFLQCNAMVHAFFEAERYMDCQFDIVHAHDWLAAPALINIKLGHNRKCIFTVHSTEYGRCGNNVYGGQSANIRAIESEAINVADRVIGVSGVLCDEIKEHYNFYWDNLRRVYNGIECLPYDGELWDPAQIRSMYNVGPMDPMVLFVGRMATQKGPDILVEAIPMVRSSQAFLLTKFFWGWLEDERADILIPASSVSVFYFLLCENRFLHRDRTPNLSLLVTDT